MQVLRKMCFGLAHKFRLHVWVREFLLWPPNFIFQLELVRCVANQSDQLLSHLSVPVQNTQLLHAQPHISHVHEQSKMWLFLSECQSDRGGSKSFILKNIFWSLLLLILSVFFCFVVVVVYSGLKSVSESNCCINTKWKKKESWLWFSVWSAGLIFPQF